MRREGNTVGKIWGVGEVEDEGGRTERRSRRRRLRREREKGVEGG